MSKKKVVLGRGLSALLGNVPSLEAEKKAIIYTNEVSLKEVETNPLQPRKHFDREAIEELSQSIKVHGIIQPITVRRLAHNRYQLIAGERRYHAAKLAGLTTAPAHIRVADDQQLLEMALIENIQRESLTPIEVALSYQRLIAEVNLKQDELGNRVGKKRATVSNYLRLLKLPPVIQTALNSRKITMGHARTLINAGAVDTQLFIFKKIISEGLSVRQTEALTRRLISPPNRSAQLPTKQHNDNDMVQLQSKLSTHFGTRVNIKGRGNKGGITIPFLSTEDLNRILDILGI